MWPPQAVATTCWVRGSSYFVVEMVAGRGGRRTTIPPNLSRPFHKYANVFLLYSAPGYGTVLHTEWHHKRCRVRAPIGLSCSAARRQRKLETGQRPRLPRLQATNHVPFPARAPPLPGRQGSRPNRRAVGAESPSGLPPSAPTQLPAPSSTSDRHGTLVAAKYTLPVFRGTPRQDDSAGGRGRVQ